MNNKKINNLSVFLTVLFLLSSTATVEAAGYEPLKVLEKPNDLNPAKVKLGRKLYFDKRLSKDNTISCASCHDLKTGGSDGKVVSTGIGGKQGNINSPTVYNSGLLFRQFWDGRSEHLIDQADGPVQNPVEMGSLWPQVIAKLAKDNSYQKEFKAIYKDGNAINRKNIKNAIVEFERSLVTINSPFDRYLKGDQMAIDDKAKNGYKLFKHYGCASCHQGAAVGGNMFQVFGVLNDYFRKRGNITEADRGRFNLTGNKTDMHKFKVPSLRMVAMTPPYLHDGNAKTLREAVDIMFEYQIGRKAPDKDKDDIVHFLKTLTGKHKELNN